MAAAGGYARILNQKEPTEVHDVLGQIFMAGFTGLCLYWVAGWLNIDQGLMFGVAGIAGWVGLRALDGIGVTLKKQTGIDFLGKKDEE